MRAPLYITDTAPGGGKTVLTLGLVTELGTTFDSVGFIKPVGLARVRAGNAGIDIDAMLVDKVCQTRSNIEDMSPVTVSRSIWPKVTPEESGRMMEKIEGAFGRVSEGKDIVVVEGTGHAALGAVMGLSNARVAKALGTRVLLASAYSDLERNALDALELSRGYFEAMGVPVLGAVVNRVPAEQLDSYTSYARDKFDEMGVRFFGCIPEEPALTNFQFLQVSEYLDGEMLCGEAKAERVISSVRVGAMVPHRAIGYFQKSCLVITPGDREDVIVTACAAAAQEAAGPSGMVLSGGIRPHDRIIELLRSSGMPIFLATEDSYTVASRIHDMPLRIQPNDAEKIATVQGLVSAHVEVDRIVSALES